MKLKCSGLDLSDAINTVIKATTSKTVNGILEGIKLSAENDYLLLTATDLELGIEKRIKADIIIEGEVVVPGKLFAEYIKKLASEDVELSLIDTNKLKIKYTDSEGYLQCYNVNEYPSLKKIDSNEYFSLKGSDLKSLINKSIISVALDDSRPILKGVLLEVDEDKISAVALDGYRLALITKPLIQKTASVNVVVPSRSLSEISKLISEEDEEVKIYIQKNYLMVDLNDTIIITRLLDGDFINYKKIIPSSESTTITLNREQFGDALERASLLSRGERNNIVQFDIKEKTLTISSNSEIGSITENVTITLSGKDLKIAFNAKYILEVLRTLNDEFIKLNFGLAIDPCIIKPDLGDEYLYLILPVRMPN